MQILRVHDELTLEMVDTGTRKLIYDVLVSKGAGFRKGLGICGRMANFLDNSSGKINLAFAILLSLPGIPVIYYGDEIGAQNSSEEYIDESTKKREKVLKAIDIDSKISPSDSRDVHRGPILKDDFDNSMKDGNNHNNVIYKTVKNLIKVRKETPILKRGTLSKIESDKKEIFSYLRISGDQQIIIVNNLSGVKSEAVLMLSRDLDEKIDKTKYLTNLINGEEIKVCSECKKLILSIEPYQTLWLK